MGRRRRDSLLDQLTPEDEADTGLFSRCWRYVKERPIFSRCMKHERPETRSVRVGHRASAALGDEACVPEKHIDNRVVSSKYSVLTFLPKNLFEQFRRIANFYFLVVGIVQLLIDTPVTPITSILPLVFVITVTAIKQGYEDWLRHKADREVNHKKSAVVEGGRLRDCKSMDIKVGDVVRVQINEELPCDMVMLSSSDPEGKCYITTANLDGETSLKTQVCVAETRRFQLDSEFESLEARVECEQPLADLYTFVGRIHVAHGNGEKVLRPLGVENILLRGSRLKNTAFVYGCAIYTGQETKVALNSKFKKSKFSRIEKRMNTFLILFMVLLFFLSSLFCGLKHWYTSTFDLPPYVPTGKDDLTVMIVIEDFLAFMVLFNYVIPISLYVTVEVQKFVGSLFFTWDVDMYDGRTDLPAQANTSDLNEELGQVEYLFTDKTGTLTENKMCFQLCSVHGQVYEEVGGHLCRFPSPVSHPNPTTITPKLEEFFTVLALCHTVRVDNISGGDGDPGAATMYSATGEDYDYQAASPDEKALVEACRRYGIIYHGMKDGCMEVTFQTEMRRYRILHILDFTATRRCMSVIMQNEKDEIYLLCKGAEVALFNKLSSQDSGDLIAARTHVNQFAVLGLRTLAVAHRKLSPEVYESLDSLLKEARTSLQDREQKLEEVFGKVEQDLTLLGITAVEDKLQDQVPETITALRHAGIKVWVLTGDKEETAVNISKSTGHFHSGMGELRLTQCDDTEKCKETIVQLYRTLTMAERGEEHVLIVDGQSLTFALNDHRPVLLKLGQRCVAVLCCRMSPIQKAQVVRLIKQSENQPVTAAIGDGANDVSMIQEADVGLGIMGKEGRQAVQNSDYAFGKFRFLPRALLLHGHYYYVRLSTLVQYFFYKNVAIITPQVFYQTFSAFSEQTVFDPFFLLFYNITFTSLPILIYAIFEQHIHRDKLLHKPSLYRRISKNSNMSWLKFTQWSALGLWHGSVCFFGGFLLFENDVSVGWDGKLYGLTAWGSLIHIAVVLVVNFKLMLLTYYWSWPIVAAFVFSAVGNLLLSFLVTGLIWPSWATDSNSFYGVQLELFSSVTVWLFFLVIVIIALLPDILIRIIRDIRNHRSIYRPFTTESETPSTDLSRSTELSDTERPETFTFQAAL